MYYVLATTEKIVRWYSYDSSQTDDKIDYTIIDQLDLNRVPRAATKAIAKSRAQAMGLNTWRYVKMSH